MSQGKCMPWTSQDSSTKSKKHLPKKLKNMKKIIPPTLAISVNSVRNRNDDTLKIYRENIK